MTSLSYWTGRRALVTGATGMLGSWLVKQLLNEGASVVALVLDADPQSELVRSGDLQRVNVVNGALEDLSAVDRAVNLHDVDTVFHLGAQTVVPVAHRSPLGTFESNIRGTYHLLEVCRRSNSAVRRIVIASSDKAYGAQTELPYHEGMPLNGRHPYDVSKSCADLIAQAYHHTYGLPVAIARCGNIYGGGDLNWSRIVPGTIRATLRSESPVIRSNGKFLRDYVYVEDVVRAYLDLAAALDDEQVVGQAFNFSNETPTSVLELVAMIQDLMGDRSHPPDIRDAAEGEIEEQHLSSAKARNILGWTPKYEFEAGLVATIGWYRALLGS
jgi:CDP-glucose 4,6-dehydratase